MVTQFNPHNPNIGKLIHHNWNMIQNNEELSKVFPQPPLIGFRRLPKLRDKLCSSFIKFPPQVAQVKSPIPKLCTRLGKCTYCPLFQEIETFTSHWNGREFICNSLPKKNNITCELSNLIYIIKCKQCNQQYIGETSRPFRLRIYEHKFSVMKSSTKKSTSLSRHFCQLDHIVMHIQFSVIHWLGNNSPDKDMTQICRRKELYYIWAANAVFPSGINQYTVNM